MLMPSLLTDFHMFGRIKHEIFRHYKAYGKRIIRFKSKVYQWTNVSAWRTESKLRNGHCSSLTMDCNRLRKICITNITTSYYILSIYSLQSKYIPHHSSWQIKILSFLTSIIIYQYLWPLSVKVYQVTFKKWYLISQSSQPLTLLMATQLWPSLTVNYSLFLKWSSLKPAILISWQYMLQTPT